MLLFYFYKVYIYICIVGRCLDNYISQQKGPRSITIIISVLFSVSSPVSLLVCLFISIYKGAGAGGMVGAELTDFVMVLNTKEAVKTFSQFGNLTLGGNVSGKYVYIHSLFFT